MNTEEVYNKLIQQVPDAGLELHPAETGDSWITVQASDIRRICLRLRDDGAFGFNTLMCLSGVHYQNEEALGVTYHLHSTTRNQTVVLKVIVPVETPEVPSVESVWKTADWHEREAWDMVGIVFEDHPDLRRILCPEDWLGYPLRKDYQPQSSYRGMKTGH